MDNEYTPQDAGNARLSDDAAVLDELGQSIIRFGGDFVAVSNALDRLTPDTRQRVLNELIANCRALGDRAHDVARAVMKMQKG